MYSQQKEKPNNNNNPKPSVLEINLFYESHKIELNKKFCFCFQVVHLPGVGCTQAIFQVHIIRPPIQALGIAHGWSQYQVVTVWNWSFTHLTWGHVVGITCTFVTALQVTVLRLATMMVSTQYAPFTPLAHHCGSGSVHTDTDMVVKGSTLPTQRFLLTVSMTTVCQS